MWMILRPKEKASRKNRSVHLWGPVRQHKLKCPPMPPRPSQALDMGPLRFAFGKSSHAPRPPCSGKA